MKPIYMSRRLSFGMALAITLIVALVGGGFYLFTTARLKQEFAQKAEEIQSYLNGSLAPLLWNLDHETVVKVARTILRNDFVVQVTIQGSDRQNIFSERQGAETTELTLTQPVRFDDRIIGYLIVGFSQAPLKRELADILWVSVSVWFMALLTIVTLNTFLIGKFFRGPLDTFTELTRAYRQNPESPPASATPYVEFRPIEEVVRSLANDVYQQLLRERENEAKYRERLERQVEARTAELNTANERLTAANSELSESRSRYRNLYEKSPDCLMSIEVETGCIVECNSRVPETLGIPRERIIGEKIVSMYDEASRERAMAAFAQLVRDGEVHGAELKVTRANGSTIDVLLDSTGFYDADGQMPVALSSWRDITRRIEFEKSLEEANQRLSELDRMKSMFIASISHELRTPLNSIIGFSGIILSGMSGELNEEQQDSINRINRAGKHLLSLITDIIDISKIEAGKIDRSLKRFSLEEVVHEAVDNVQADLTSKGLTLNIDAASWPSLYSDRKHLLQCLLNYLSNAAKYTESGSITISVRDDGDRVHISVADTGIGVPEEEISKLFQPFERLDNDLRVKAGGTGLGLYLVKKIVSDLLEGDVSVKSRLEEGSVFSLHLPKELKAGTHADIS